MRRLWVAAALAPLTFAASAAMAGTTCTTTLCTVSGTSPVDTATVDSGAANNIAITGSVTPVATTTTSTAAVTIDSNNTVNNSGTINFSGISSTTTAQPTPTAPAYLAGIQANSGVTSEILNSGTISITETTTGDTTNQGYETGPFANGTNRYGVYLAPGSFTGLTTDANNTGRATAIDNTGTITIVGENSAAIYSAANITGDILQAGTITVTGGSYSAAGVTPNTNLDVSYGILTTGTINGAVNITGAISATGQNAVGVALNQGATGLLTIDNTITATGYRSTANPGLSTAPLLNVDQVLQGGPALYVGGSVGGGILVTAPVTATSTVTAVTGGTITSYGGSPAILIGGANPLTVGQEGTSGSDLVVGGSVLALGVYDNETYKTYTLAPGDSFDATAIQIGGVNGETFAVGGTNVGGANVGGVDAGNPFAAVTLANGLSIAGTVSATTLSNVSGHGNATALHVGSGANVGAVTVSGTLSASAQTAFTTTAPGGTNVVALKIDHGGSVTSLNNSGSILATVSPILTLQGNVGVYTGGTSTTAPIAVQDSAGSLTSITNSNTITAAYINASTANINPSGVNARGTAFDLSANTTGVTLTQNAFTGTLPTGVTSITPSITGNIIFGSGAAAMTINAGKVTGDITYGANLGNALTISGADATTTGVATVTGSLAQANGGALAINVNNGSLVLTAPTSTTVGGGTATINLSSLTLGSTGAVTMVVDPTDANGTTAQFNVTGATTLASGAKINVAVTALPTSLAKTYTLIVDNTNAFGTAGVATSFVGATPYILSVTPTLTPTGAGGDALTFAIGEKSTAELTALTTNERKAFDPVYQALVSDTSTTDGLVADILSKTTANSFRKVYDQFLPDFAGGPYQSLETGQEAIYRAESDVPIKLQTDQRRGWVQEIGFSNHRDNSDSGGYNGGGFGVVAGLESAQGDGAVGVTAAYLTTNVKDTAQSADGHLAASLLETGVYWRSGGTGLNFDASVNGGWAFFDSQRLFLDSGAPDPTTGSSTTVAKVAQSNWSGGVVAAHVGVKAPLSAGRFYARPEVSVDYYALYEGAHKEHGGGSAFDLSVASRTSQETLAQADLVLGVNLGEVIRWRPELTVGWRDVVEGGPGATTARFTGGSAFSIEPNFQDKGGLLARLGVRAGGAFADFSADAGGEFLSGSQSYDARALARFLF